MEHAWKRMFEGVGRMVRILRKWDTVRLTQDRVGGRSLSLHKGWGKFLGQLSNGRNVCGKIERKNVKNNNSLRAIKSVENFRAISEKIIRLKNSGVISRNSLRPCGQLKVGVRLPAGLRFLSSPKRPDRGWIAPSLLSSGNRVS